MTFSWVDALTQSCVTGLILTSVKFAVLVGFAGVVAWWWRRASAVYLHLLWFGVLSSLLLLPVTSVILPQWQVPFWPTWTQVTLPQESPSATPVFFDLAHLPKTETSSDTPALPLVPSARKTSEKRTSAAEPKTTVTGQVAKPSPETNWLSPRRICRVAFGVWLLGFLVFLVRLLLGWWSLSQIRRQSQKVTSGKTWTLLQTLRAELSIRRPVDLLLNQARWMPMTWGIRRAVVCLPACRSDWSEDRLRMVLRHELAHVQRHDCLTQWLAQLLRAVYWFHPLTWWALGRLRLEQERACDDAVLHSGAEPTMYAEQLLAVSSGRLPGRCVTPVALAMSRAALLKRRLVALLDSDQRRSPLKRRSLLVAGLVAVSLLIPLAVLQGRAATDENASRNTVASKTGGAASQDDVEKVWRILQERYVKPLDKKKLTEKVIRGMLEGLEDPYSSYFSPADMARFKNATQGEVVGIGARIRMQDKQLVIDTPLPGSPALRAGLRPKDIVMTIDGKATNTRSLQECVNLLRGKRNTVVGVQILRGGNKLKIKITRDRVKLSTVKGFQRTKKHRWVHILDGKNKVGYVEITQFNPGTPNELRQVLTKLNQQGMKGLILDLRSCPGGFLKSAIEVCDLFLSEGQILSTKGGKTRPQSWKATKDSTVIKVPVLVLVNARTASSAEIVAGALQDNKRARVLGSRTYGKGSVQSLIGLNSGGAIRLTTAYHYLPGGRNIQKKTGTKTWGIDPDDGFYVPLTATQTEMQNRVRRDLEVLNGQAKPQPVSPERLTKEFFDPQLAAALLSMRARIADGQFKKVGLPLSALRKRIERLVDLENRRAALQRDLEVLTEQMQDLQRQLGEKK